MSNRIQFVRRTAAILMAFGLILGLLPGCVAAQDLVQPGRAARLQAWTKAAPTEPETDATIKHFAAMSREEIDAYVSDLSRQFIAAREASIEAAGGQQDLPFWTGDRRTGISPTLPLELLRKIADLTLLPPKINTNPLPEFDDDRPGMNYALNLGFERTPGGRLWNAWLAGGDSPQGFLAAAISDDGGDTWSKPRLVVKSHIPDFMGRGIPLSISIHMANFWTDPLGRLWLFFDQTQSWHDGRSGLWATICENPDADEPVWSEPVRLWHGTMLNKPTVMANGEWWLPVYITGFSVGFFGRTHGSPVHLQTGTHDALIPQRNARVLVSADQGRTWELRGRVVFPNPSWTEHMFVELKDGRVWMLTRTERVVMQSFSSDGGWTWTEPDLPTFSHPRARFHVRRLASGRILLIKHGKTIDSLPGLTRKGSSDRTDLTAWLSEDEGQTWFGGLMLDDREDISYPDAIQLPDGAILVTYDRERSPLGEIYMARFREEDIRAASVVSPDTRLRHLIVKRPRNRR